MTQTKLKRGELKQAKLKPSRLASNRFPANQFTSLRCQKGLGIFSLIFYVAIFGGLLTVGFKALPAYSEYMKISRMVKKLGTENHTSAASAAQSFDRSSSVEDVRSISGKDLGFELKNGKGVVSFAYQNKIPLIPPASLVFDFEGSSQ